MTAELKPIEKARKWTVNQKKMIIDELKREGSVKTVCAKYSLHQSTIARWRRQAEEGENHFLGPKNPQFNQKIKKLEVELEQMRDVIVSQAHEIALLKKRTKLV